MAVGVSRLAQFFEKSFRSGLGANNVIAANGINVSDRNLIACLHGEKGLKKQVDTRPLGMAPADLLAPPIVPFIEGSPIFFI